MTKLEYLFREHTEFTHELMSGRYQLAVEKGVAGRCGLIDCDDCDFHGKNRPCENQRAEWLLTEHIMLTKFEKSVLNRMSKDFKYIARDLNGKLYAYNYLPYRDKEDGDWVNRGKCELLSSNLFGDIFLFIDFSNDSPTSIEYLQNLEVEE